MEFSTLFVLKVNSLSLKTLWTFNLFFEKPRSRGWVRFSSISAIAAPPPFPRRITDTIYFGSDSRPTSRAHGPTLPAAYGTEITASGRYWRDLYLKKSRLGRRTTYILLTGATRYFNSTITIATHGRGGGAFNGFTSKSPSSRTRLRTSSSSTR